MIFLDSKRFFCCYKLRNPNLVVFRLYYKALRYYHSALWSTNVNHLIGTISYFKEYSGNTMVL